MRVYIDLDENIDNVSELHAYIITRDDKYIRVGGDIKLWATEKIGRWIPVYQGDEIINHRCSECELGSTFGKSTYGMNFCPKCGIKMEVKE